MRKAKLLLFLLLLSTLSFGAGRVNGLCSKGGVKPSTATIPSSTNVVGSYPGCTVTVYTTGTMTLATIYSNNSGTTKANPFTADATTGAYFFYSEDANVDIRLSGGGIPSPLTIGAEPVIDPFFTGTDSLTPRQVSSKLGDILSVKDYGALGSGSGNDLTSIQNAMDAACVDTPSPRVYFPAGNYWISGTLALNCALEIFGDGPQASYITEKTQSSLTRGITTDYSLNLHDMGINTAALVNTNLGMTAVARGFGTLTSVGQSFHFNNVSLVGWNFGLIISGKDNFTDIYDSVTIQNSYIQVYSSLGAVSNPINIANGKIARIENNTLIGDSHGDHAVYSIAVRDVAVSHNVMQDYINSAVKILTSGFGGGSSCPMVTNDYPGWSVSYNTITNSNIAIAMYSYCTIVVPNVNFTSNIIWNSTNSFAGDFASVYIQASCNSVMGNVVSMGNTFSNIGLGGIVLLSSVQFPLSPCPDSMAQGTIANFSSTGDSFTDYSTNFSGTFPAINSSGTNLGSASITGLKSNGAAGALSLGNFASVNIASMTEINNSGSPSSYASQEIKQTIVGKPLFRYRQATSATADIGQFYDGAGNQIANITVDAYPNFPGVSGLKASNGTAKQHAHMISGHFQMTTGALTITLSGAGVFTSSSTWECVGANLTAARAFSVSIISGTRVDLTGTGSDTIALICMGN